MSGDNVYRLRDHSKYIAELRAELESAKSEMCSHGVTFEHCNEHHDSREDDNDA